jgi:hypothetical protein
MISPFETDLEKLAQNIIEVIGTCQRTAEQEGVEVIAYALEHARTSLLLMVRFQCERERFFKDFIQQKASKAWKKFAENGGVHND